VAEFQKHACPPRDTMLNFVAVGQTVRASTGSQKFGGALPRPLKMGHESRMNDESCIPKNHALPHKCYHSKYGQCRSNCCCIVIMQILQKSLTLQMPSPQIFFSNFGSQIGDFRIWMCGIDYLIRFGFGSVLEKKLGFGSE